MSQTGSNRSYNNKQRNDQSSKPKQLDINNLQARCNNPGCLAYIRDIIMHFEYIEKDNNELQEKIKKYQDYSKIMDENNKAQALIRNLQEEKNHHETEAERLQMEKENLINALDKMERDHQNAQRELQDKHQEVNNIQSNTRQQHESASKNMEQLSRKIEELQRENQGLYADISGKRREIKTLKQQVDQGDQSVLLQRKTKENEQLKRQLADSSQNLQHAQRQSQQYLDNESMYGGSQRGNTVGGRGEHVKRHGNTHQPQNGRQTDNVNGFNNDKIQSQLQPPQNQQKVEFLEQTIDDQKNHINQLKLQLNGQNNERQDRVDEMEDVIDQLNNDLRERERVIQNLQTRLNNEADEFNRQIYQLGEDNLHLKQQIKVGQSNIRGLADREKTYQQQIKGVNELRDKDVGSLRERIKQLERQIMGQETAIGTLENQNNQLKLVIQEIKGNKNQTHKDLTDETIAQRREIDFLKDLVQQRTREAQNHETCQNKISQLLSDNQQLQHIISDKNHNIQDLKDRMIEIERQSKIDFEEQRKKVETQMIIAFDSKYLDMQNRLEDKIQHLQIDLEKERQGQQKLNRNIGDFQNEKDQFLSQIDELKSRNTQLNFEQQQVRNTQYQNMNNLEQKNFLEQENQKLKMEVKDLEFINQDVRTRFETQAQFYAEKTRELENKTTQQEGQITQLREQLHHTELERKTQISQIQQSQLKERQTSTNQIENQIDHYKRQISQLELQNSEEKMQMQHEMEILKSDLNILSTDLLDKEQSIGFLKSENEELKSRKSDNNVAQEHVKHAAKKTHEQQSQIMQLEQKINSLNLENEAIRRNQEAGNIDRSRMNKLEDDNQNLQKIIVNQQQQIDQNQRQGQNVAQQNQKVQNLRRENQNLQSQIQNLNSQISSLQKDIQQRDNDIQTLIQEVSEKNQNLAASTNNEIQNKNREIEILKTRINNLEAQGSSGQKNEELENRLVMIVNENERLNFQCKKYEEQLASSNQGQNQEGELEKAYQMLGQRRKEFDELQSQYKLLKEDFTKYKDGGVSRSPNAYGTTTTTTFHRAPSPPKTGAAATSYVPVTQQIQNNNNTQSSSEQYSYKPPGTVGDYKY